MRDSQDRPEEVRVVLGLDPHRDDDRIDTVLLEPGVADQRRGTSMDLGQAQATGAACFAGRGLPRVGLTRAQHGAVVADADRTTEQADGAVS